MRKLSTLSVVAVLGIAIAAVDVTELLVALADRVSPGALFRVRTTERVVALTIDDSPSAATDEILDVLREQSARATFFVIGENVLHDSVSVDAILAGGHELGHHMMTDEPSIRLSATRFQSDFAATETILTQHGGTRWFRPGSGWYDRSMVSDVQRRGYRLVLGSVYPFDAHVGVPWLASRWILANTRPGSIIVLHDGLRRGRRTAAVLRKVLPELRRRGYEVVTVSELHQRAPAPPETPHSESGSSGQS